MKALNINKTYNNKNGNVHALQDITLTFDKIGMVFIVGASGCGKTTLLNIISGKDKKYRGELVVSGVVEVIEQDIILMESMSVMDNLLLVSNNKEHIRELLVKLQMDEHSHKKIKRLSIGQKKRVQIIRSLLVESTYLVCDEPTASLDYENIDIVMNALMNVAKERTVIIVTHEIALVDKYADRCIQMDKGSIIADKVITERNSIREVSIVVEKDISKQVRCANKVIKSRPIEIILKGCLIWMLMLSIFVSMSLFSALSKSVVGKNNWKYSNNVIITQPKQVNAKEGKESGLLNNQKYQLYDVYDKESIRLVRDNVKGVIGYRCGWVNDQYTLDGSFAPEMNIDAVKKAISEGERIALETGKQPFEQFESWKEYVARANLAYPNGDFPKDIILTYDFRNYEGFKRDNNTGQYNIPLGDNVIIGNRTTPVVPYQMFDNYDMDLQYGSTAKTDDEVVLSANLATQMCKENQLASEKDLIGKKIETYITDYSNQPIKLTVSGIFYDESIYENQMYLKEGAWDKKIEALYQMNSEKVKYLYVYFLCDETVDRDAVVTKVNQTLQSNESNFVSYGDSILLANNSVEYQNPIYFYVFALFVFIALATTYCIMQLALHKRIYKEWAILQRYGYQPLFVTLIPISIALLLGGLIQGVGLSFVCQNLNIIANTLGFASIVEYDIIQYLFSFIISVAIIFIVEGGYYVIRIKKH